MASAAKATGPVAPAKITTSKPAPKKTATKASPQLKVVTNKEKVAANNLFMTGQALEHSRAATLICDLDWNIVYANQRSRQLLVEAESDLQSVVKSFLADEIEGFSFEAFFADQPQEFRALSNERNHPHESQVSLGTRNWDIQVSSLLNANGETVGYAIDWNDITAKLSADEKTWQIVQALEGCSTNVMIADANLNVVYRNTALKQNLKKWEPEFQKVFGASFNAEQVLGRCIDDFHKDPSHQRRVLANESIFPFKTHITVGPVRIDLAVNSIKDHNGKTIGYTTEWLDVTERLASEEQYKAKVREIAERMEFLRGACSTDLANAMESLANGDLTVTITPRTPLLEIPEEVDLALMAQTFNDLRNQTVKAVEAYNTARESLSSLVAETRLAADSIARSSSEVSIGNDDLAQRTEEQASSLEETASSMEEMTSTVKQNADNARQANQLAMQAKESAEKGGVVVNDAVTTMAEINTASKRIADIISVIDEIAFQTNLLALNAAVEAARVGEQGRGFAVVAGEVRNLAGRSASAAKEIKALVQDSVHKVEQGSSLVNQSGQQLDEIVNSVKKVADIISEIAAAAQEQSEGIEQVNKAIIQMDQITQQNAALVEEASATSESMNNQAIGLQNLVNQFTLDAAKMSELMAAAQAAAKAEERAAPAASRVRKPSTEPATRRTSRFAKADARDDFEEF